MTPVAMAACAIAAGLIGVCAASAQDTTTEQGNVACGPRKMIVEELQQKFQEEPTARGLVNETQLMEIFVSESGKFTVLMSDVAGQSCLVASGEGFDSETIRAAHRVATDYRPKKGRPGTE